jgi:light-regulated signal transduction histidine kinase (bacteriophytochrome)
MRMAAEASLKALTADLEFRNRELEDFAHIASHDLKEPLRKIVLFSDKLIRGRSGMGEADTGDQLERMRKSALRMNELIDGLLSYSRIPAGNQPLQRIDLKSVMSEVIQDLEVRIGETKGRVEVGELPFISADPLQMRELFQNLIGNALKYHRDGVPPVVVVSAERRNDTVEISVSDNGIGFDSKYQDRIFGIFQRLVGKNEFEGTGVGLAICKKIVQKHNGTISARGEPGRGATFTIRLPSGE